MIQIIALLILMSSVNVHAMDEDADPADPEVGRICAEDDEEPIQHQKPITSKKRREEPTGCFGCSKKKKDPVNDRAHVKRKKKMTRSRSVENIRTEITLDQLEPSQRIFYFRQSPDDAGPLYFDASRSRSMTRAFMRGNPNASPREASIQDAAIDAQQRGDIVQLLHCIHEIGLQNQGKLTQLVQQGQAQQAKSANQQKLYSLALNAGSLAVMIISFIVTKYL